MSLAKQEFTDAGRSMLGRAQAAEVLTISKIVVGDGAANSASELWPLTALKSWKMDVTISARRDYGQGTLLVEGSFLSSSAPSSFALREVGVMAHIGSEADRLYSVANVLTDPPDTIDPASPSLQAFKIKLVVDRIPADQIIIQIGPSENVVGENLATDADGKGVYKEAAGNVLRFKRLAAGANTSIDENPEQTVLTIGQSVLTHDVDLYVPASHPQCPKPEVGFPTIQAAHDYLLQFTIPASLLATIHVYSGTFTVPKPGLKFTHPNSSQIRLWGEPRETRNITAIASVGGGKDVTFTGAAPANGQRVYIAGAQGWWMGGCKVTSVRGNIVGCNHYNRSGRTQRTGNSTGRLCWFPTQVVAGTGYVYGENLLDAPYGIREIKNMVFDGPPQSFTVCPAFGGIIDSMAMGSKRGISGGDKGSIVLGGECVVCDCDFGFICDGAGGGLDQTIFNGCGQAVNPGGGGNWWAAIQVGLENSILYLVANLYGVNCPTFLIGGQFIVEGNAYGLQAYNNGSIQLNSADNFQSAFGNNGIDLYANMKGLIGYWIHGGVTPTTNPQASVGADGVGNHDSLIYLSA